LRPNNQKAKTTKTNNKNKFEKLHLKKELKVLLLLSLLLLFLKLIGGPLSEHAPLTQFHEKIFFIEF
jgi:hypothetical protein